MDEALVEHAQNNIGGGESREDESGLGSHCLLKRLGGALKTANEGGGRANCCFRRFNRVHRLTERHARRQIEGQRRRRELPLMIDR